MSVRTRWAECWRFKPEKTASSRRNSGKIWSCAAWDKGHTDYSITVAFSATNRKWSAEIVGKKVLIIKDRYDFDAAVLDAIEAFKNRKETAL